MATIRRAGFGSVFEVENETVGIGTTGTATNTLQVLGDIVTSDATVIGISTLPTYKGFLDKEARLGKSLIDINSQAGSLSGDIVIDGDVTVSSGSTLCSSVDQLTTTNSFGVPIGNTDSRVHCQTAGSMRFNQDLGTLEFYTGDEWRTVNSYNRGAAAGRALFFAGYSEPANTGTRSIDVVTISTLGNSTRFGEMSSDNDSSFGIGNETRGIYHRGGSNSNVLEYVTPASEGNPIDFGDLTQARYLGARGNSSTRGIFMSGYAPGGYNDTIDYVEMGTLGNALDFGDLNTAVFLNNNSVNSTVRVYSLGGYASPGVNISKIEYVTISSKGDALEFDDLDRPNSTFPGFANNVRGVYGGGNLRPTTSAQIYMFNTASQGKMIYFGELTQRRKEFAGSCSQTRGVFAGGQLDPSGPTTVNIMDYVTIMSAGNATDFGDLSKTPRNFTSLSDSHGGLGGF